ncbi:peptidoglycan DD-metalloendopeptidase family protein [Patescibacteria group bacterium]|nr:peptidoglycan DD-metalloendopeptidase family protein [Patescibacteria group bacterium]
MQKIKAIILPLIIYTLIFNPFSVRAQETRDIVFPIESGWDYNFNDSYGDPRSGGRTHEGIDIMVDQMTPLVAAVNGRVSYIVESDKGWGLAIYIEDSEGYSYRYLHINNDTPGTDDGKEIRVYAFPSNIVRGAQVAAGQVIAFAGDSGNAEYAGHHLHFEIWTPSRQSINSYQSLMAALGQSVATDETEVSTPTYQFSRDLELGDEGLDVKELQKYLNSHGFVVSTSGAGSPGNETIYFGPATQAALINFQKDNGISPAVGYFGPLTRNVINSSQAISNNTVTENIGTISNPVNNQYLQAGWLVRDKILPKVFYVANNLELQWIVSEEVAVREFGPNWYLTIKYFDDLEGQGFSFGDYLQ